MVYSTNGKVRVFNPRTKTWSSWLTEDEGRRLENKLLYRLTLTGQKLRPMTSASSVSEEIALSSAAGTVCATILGVATAPSKDIAHYEIIGRLPKVKVEEKGE